MTDDAASFQVSSDAAEVYEARFVPALFAPWARHLVDAAGIQPGQTVVDVACGTGIVARTAAERQQGPGRVIGIDLNQGMLGVARRLRPDLEWHRADAAALPLRNRSVDVVLCQAALMFFPDPRRALREMARVVTSAGTVGVQVWASVEDQHGWAPFYEVVRHHTGEESVDLLTTYWRLGDLDALAGLFDDAGLQVRRTLTRQGVATFGSVDEFVATEVTGTPLEEQITGSRYTAVVDDARTALAPFTATGGHLELPITGHILIATTT